MSRTAVGRDWEGEREEDGARADRVRLGCSSRQEGTPAMVSRRDTAIE